MEARADLEQAADRALDVRIPRRRLGDARENPEERALAGAVAADDADDLARADLNGEIADGPDVTRVLRRLPVPAPPRARDRVTKRTIRLAIAEAVPFRQVVTIYRNVVHDGRLEAGSRFGVRGSRSGSWFNREHRTENQTPNPEPRTANPCVYNVSANVRSTRRK